MKHKVAFIGFRHPHIAALYKRLGDHPDWKIAASCEEDPEAAELARNKWNVNISHTDFHSMLTDVEFDVLAVGDIFSLRGQRVIDGLNSGKNILSDKPLCTSLRELSQIRRIADRKNLKIGLFLDLRHHKNLGTAKDLIAAGRIGEIQSINFCGQHSLSFDSRPKWFFLPEKHGGTVNDLAIHGLDAVEFLTGHKIAKLHAARTWNAFASHVPDFLNAAQVMFSLDNGCGVIGDVSYIKPDDLTPDTPFSWRFTLWGEKGVMEFSADARPVTVYDRNGIQRISSDDSCQPDYLSLFQDELKGKPVRFGTEHVLSITHSVLKLQRLA